MGSHPEKDWDKDSAKKHLALNWTKTGSDIAFQGIDGLYKYYSGALSRKDISDYLSTNNTYSLFKQTNKRARRYNPYFVRALREVIESDVIVLFDGLSAFNDGIKYLCCYIGKTYQFFKNNCLLQCTLCLKIVLVDDYGLKV